MVSCTLAVHPETINHPGDLRVVRPSFPRRGIDGDRFRADSFRV